MFTINDKDNKPKEYDESKLSDKGKSALNNLFRLSHNKRDLDIVINQYTSILNAELPKEDADTESKE